MEKTQHPEGEVAPLDGFIGIQSCQILLLMVRSKSGINSPVEGQVVEIPFFTTGFWIHPNSGWEWDF